MFPSGTTNIYSCPWQWNDMIYKALGLYWGGFTWTQGYAESTNTGGDAFCWAHVLLGQSQVKPWGKTVIRPKVKGLQCLSAQSSQNSADPTQGLEDWLDIMVQFITGGTWWPLKKTVFSEAIIFCKNIQMANI